MREDMLRCRMSVDMLRSQCNVTDIESNSSLSPSLRVKISEVKEVENIKYKVFQAPTQTHTHLRPTHSDPGSPVLPCSHPSTLCIRSL